MKLPDWIRRRVMAWGFRRIETVDADFVVRVGNERVLQRWHIIPPNPLFSVYLHFITGDNERNAHDHRSATMSIVLDGGYWELTPARWRRWRLFGDRETIWARRSVGDVVLRGPFKPHRLELWTGGYALTLFITFPTIRRWGFWTDKGWVYWRDYVDPDDPGQKRAPEAAA